MGRSRQLQIVRFRVALNRRCIGGVLRAESGGTPLNQAMHDLAARLAGELVDVEQDLDREFEARLAETSTLAFRVAFSVLRHRQDAEDVAQEAYARAYRRFRALRDRDRFRAWLVRMTWRLALDFRRAQGRRTARELTQVDAGTPHTATDLVAAESGPHALWAAIDALPERLRLVVVLAAIEEHDPAHVAQRARPARRHREVAPVPGAAAIEGAIAMAGNSAPLDDPALNSELEALLAVEPSAGFNARVLADATRRPRWTLSWQLAPAGALAATLAIALVIHFQSAGPTALTLAGRSFASPVAFAPQLPARPAIATDPISVPAMPRSRAARHLGRQAQAQSTRSGRARRHGRIPRPGSVVRTASAAAGGVGHRRQPAAVVGRCAGGSAATARAVTGYRSAPVI